MYFAWVTAFTVGYGDLVPAGWLSRLCAMATALTGMIFTGLWVAVAVNALKITVQQLEAGENSAGNQPRSEEDT
jgi:voltage-gated potassium channel